MGNRNIDPFSDEPIEEVSEKEPEIKQGESLETEDLPPAKPIKKKKRKNTPARNVAITGTLTAISVVMMALTCYLPLTIAPLVVISLCYNLAFEKCGVPYGVMGILASVGVGFLVCAANVEILLIVTVVFVPYSLLSLLMRKLDYSTMKKAIVRIVIVTAFGALEVLFVYLLGALVAGYIDLSGIIGKIGGEFALGYVIITLISIIIFVCVDLLFMRLVKQIAKSLSKI